MNAPLSRIALIVGALLAFAAPAQATTKVQRVVSPGGIEAWLVQEKSVPLVAIDFAFEGGANQDPAAKPGVGTMTAALLDEGAGELDARAFQERADRSAVEISFRTQRDHVRGSLRVLRDKLDEGSDLLRLALTAPRFDAEPIERTRAQMLTGLRRETTNPNDIASRTWWRLGFPDHPYGRPLNGTLESVPGITRDDLTEYMRRVFARDRLKIGVVGDIDAATLAPLLDRIFGALPAKADPRPVPPARLGAVGQKVFVELDVPQTVLSFGGLGIARKDPDFIPAFVVNHILGGGSFSSRLYREVREKRGLAYSVYSYLLPLERTALIMGGTQTRSDRADETLGLIQAEIRRLAESGPTEEELEKARSYLKGSYALNFDTSGKIAAQLVQIQLDELGIDYFERRNGLIDKVTLADVRRVSKRLLDGGFLVTVVGRAQQAAPAKKEGG
ncbi:MAG: M16 family metallopeptidase [Pseudorhodoplanes sp.]